MTNQHTPQKNTAKSWLERLISILVREPQDREDIMDMLRDAENRHVLSSEMLSMMERIIQVSEMQVREVMIPKSQMVVVPYDSTLEKLLPTVINSGHSRFPIMSVYEKDVLGILLAKDLLKFYFNEQKDNFNLSQLMRPAVFTTQNKRLDILLREFRVNRNHLAIVIDEYGNVTGLVTIEDVLEQIVGEIEDEYDIDEEDGHIKQIDDETYIVKAATLVKEFNDYFATELTDVTADTIGTIILQTFGYLPKRGEVTTIMQFQFKVLHSDNKRIYLLEVKKLS